MSERVHIYNSEISEYQVVPILVTPDQTTAGGFLVAHFYATARECGELSQRLFPLVYMNDEDIPEYLDVVNRVSCGPVGESAAQRAIAHIHDTVEKIDCAAILLDDNWRCVVVCCLLREVINTLEVTNAETVEPRRVVWTPLDPAGYETTGYETVSERQYKAILREVGYHLLQYQKTRNVKTSDLLR